MWLRLPRGCAPSCRTCIDALRLDDPPWPSEQLTAKIEHSRRTDQGRLYLRGPDPTAHPALASLLALLKPGDLGVICDDPQPGLVERSRLRRETGIDYLYVTLHGANAESHDRVTGRAGSWSQALDVLAALNRVPKLPAGAHIELTQANVGELPDLVRLVAKRGIPELVISDVLSDGSPRPAALPLESAAAVEALERAWLAASQVQLRLRYIGFEHTWHVSLPVSEPAPTLNATLLDAIRQRIPMPSALAGIRALGSPGYPSSLGRIATGAEHLRDLGLVLSARGRPLVDVPPCLSGVPPSPVRDDVPRVKSDACPACPVDATCPGVSSKLTLPGVKEALKPLPIWKQIKQPPRVLILVAEGGDPLLVLSTLRGLAVTLRRRDVKVDIVSPWLGVRWNPDNRTDTDFDDEDRNPDLGEVPDIRWGRESIEPTYRGVAGIQEWLQENDLSAYDIIIASDFSAGRAALAGGTMGPDARMVVLDFHMLEGMSDWVVSLVAPGRRANAGGWWPSERLILESAFPGYVHLYLNYGVPLKQIAWRPYSLHAGHFPRGTDIPSCPTIMSGGVHMRDLPTLVEASRLLSSDVHPIDLYAPADKFEGNTHSGEWIEGNAQLQHRGFVKPFLFYSAIAQSRFVILPLKEDTNTAAGITVMIQSLMAGRPVVASSIAAVRDYVRDGVDGLLVPPGDPRALAEAIQRLDTDPVLLASLAEGARKAGRKYSTDAWADDLLSGGHIAMPVAGGGRWHVW
jgi:hypothetical protein